VKSRPILTILLWLLAAGAALGADWTAEYGRLLQKYVTPDGVRYAAWKRNPADLAALQRVTEGVAQKQTADLAYYLNAYNAWILREALAKYPTKSVKDPLLLFFVSNRITVAGRKMSFNTLEKEEIRSKFKEPRIHFALNCASRSCPPLAREPYRAENLDAQLEAVAKAFVNSDNGVRQSANSVALSKIFDWYREDFGGKPGVIRFIDERRSSAISSAAKISYQDYNWNLNETK
jgi:hypothetical protein